MDEQRDEQQEQVDVDVAVFASLLVFCADLVPVLETTQLALGTLYLQGEDKDHPRCCVCFRLFREAVSTLAAMTSCASSTMPTSTAGTPGATPAASASVSHRWCRASLYLEAAMEKTTACQVDRTHTHM